VEWGFCARGECCSGAAGVEDVGVVRAACVCACIEVSTQFTSFTSTKVQALPYRIGVEGVGVDCCLCLRLHRGEYTHFTSFTGTNTKAQRMAQGFSAKADAAVDEYSIY
jgi:hypothetical protein